MGGHRYERLHGRVEWGVLDHIEHRCPRVTGQFGHEGTCVAYQPGQEIKRSFYNFHWKERYIGWTGGERWDEIGRAAKITASSHGTVRS